MSPLEPESVPTSNSVSTGCPLQHLQNIGFCVTESAHRWPQALAVAEPLRQWQDYLPWLRPAFLNRSAHAHRSSTQFNRITYSELERHSNQIARGLVSMGVEPGTRMALMIPPGIQFVTWVFGLFKAQAVIILIDPGMGRKNMFRCLAEANPQGLVGIPLAHLVRNLFRGRLPNCRHNIVLGSWPGCHRARSFQSQPVTPPPQLSFLDREQPAAVIFTTGSTGPPKGVLYRHRTFIEQARQIRDYFSIQPGTVDVSGFPLFALFNIGMGAATVFPKMNATRPAQVHPPEIIQAIETFQADQSFGSPALWNTVSRYCARHGVRLPSIKRVLSAGAPVPSDLLQRIKPLIAEDGEVFTPYGATEALPVACISASEVLQETATRSRQGAGTCVGSKFPDLQWQVIRITDLPIPTIEQCEFLPAGEIGELIVKGAVVTDQYVTRTDANAAHKIKDGADFWHRMGDVGYLDDRDRFWFCGRKSHRVPTLDRVLFTIPCEAIFNNHPHVYRSALVGIREFHVGRQQKSNESPIDSSDVPLIPVMIVEPLPEHWPKTEQARVRLIKELLELAAEQAGTKSIQQVLLHPGLPVDIRHNSKIFREQLRPWAEQLLARTASQQ